MLNQRLNELFTFDSETGKFFWRVDVPSYRGKAKIGEEAGWVAKSDGYRYMAVDGKRYLAHRLVWLCTHGNFPLYEIDHINGIRTDNSPKNLRAVTHKWQQRANQGKRADSKNPYKGVKRYGKGRWGAQIRFCGQTHWKGGFRTAEDAHAWYCKRASELFGEFART